mgnify:CR=1 FL=1
MQIDKSKVNGGVKREKDACFFDKYSMCYFDGGMWVNDKPYSGAPKIVLNGQDYFANEAVIVSELPDGYSYAGELTDQEKEFAYINGAKYYLPMGTESIDDFYVYQECGTPVSEQEIDNTKRQWAYVKWSLGQ